MRSIDYLRISVTDKCNLSCNYCIPENGLMLAKDADILSVKEILRLVRIFALLGGKKVRFTGGEPLVHKDILSLIEGASHTPGIENVCLTTNGVLLDKQLSSLKKAGLQQVNISLDTLKRKRFEKITGKDLIRQVCQGIDRVLEENTIALKVNTVIMKGINNDEIIDFVEYALKHKIGLRFIEFMKVTPLWDEKYYLPVEKIQAIIGEKYDLVKTDEGKNSPAEYYRIGDQPIGFIRTHRDNCSRCDRIRVTPVGRLKVCLYEDEGIDLRALLRGGESNQVIGEIFKQTMKCKKDVDFSQWKDANIYMSSVGG